MDEFVGFFGVEVIPDNDSSAWFVHVGLGVFDDLTERRYVVEVGQGVWFGLEVVLVEMLLYYLFLGRLVEVTRKQIQSYLGELQGFLFSKEGH